MHALTTTNIPALTTTQLAALTNPALTIATLSNPALINSALNGYNYSYTNNTISSNTISSKINISYGDISAEKFVVGGRDVGRLLEKICDRLCILEEDIQKNSQFTSLKKAYNNYKTIESLCSGSQVTHYA